MPSHKNQNSQRTQPRNKKNGRRGGAPRRPGGLERSIIATSHPFAAVGGGLVAPRRRVMLRASLLGYIPSSTLPVGTTGFFIVKGNNVYSPFNTSNKPDSATGYITETYGSASTEQFLGYSLYTSQYCAFRTDKSRITVRMSPGSQQNGDMMLSVFAVDVNNTGLIGALPITYQAERSQMYHKHRVCTASSPANQNVVTASACTSQVLGMTKAVWDAQAVTPISASLSSINQWVWIVQYRTLDGTTVASPCGVEIEYEQEVEFSNPTLPYS